MFDNLSVRENLTLMASMDADRHAPLLAAFPILEARMAQSAGTLSGGERKILSFVRGIAETGQLLLLDEPSEGVQHENVERMTGFVREAKAAGRALLVVEQNLSFALEIADRVIVMDHGEVVLAGAAADITEETLAAPHARVASPGLRDDGFHRWDDPGRAGARPGRARTRVPCVRSNRKLSGDRSGEHHEHVGLGLPEAVFRYDQLYVMNAAHITKRPDFAKSIVGFETQSASAASFSGTTMSSWLRASRNGSQSVSPSSQ